MTARLGTSRPQLNLTEKEERTLSLLVLGYTPTGIADELNLSRNYIYYLLRLLRVRYDVETNAGIVLRAIAEGTVSETGEIRRK